MSSTKTAKKTSSTKKTSAAAASKDKKAKSEEVKDSKAASPAQDQTSATEKKERQRRTVDKESVDTAFTDLQARIAVEIERLREADGKVRGIKFLRSIGKAIKTLHSDTKRVMKLKKRNNRKTTVESGFLRPVKISKELAQFTGWDAAQTYLRRNVTKHICNYIKEHHLYDEKDKRNILCDDKLKALLNYDPANVPMGKDGKPAVLNYFRLQKYLKPHFIKIEGVVKAEVEKLESKTEAPSAEAKAAKKEKPATTKKPTAAKAAAPAKAAAKPAAAKVEDEDVEDEDLDD